MNFLENEIVQFLHPAISSKIEGSIVVTNLRLIFHTKDSKHQKEIVWTNIASIDYSPSHDDRTAIRVKTIIEGEKPLAIQLIGSNKEQRISEFLRMKSIISDLRKATTVRSVTPATVSASGAIETKPPKQATISIPEDKLVELRSNLLKADRQLAAQYKELVTGKILSEEDFWNSHTDLLQSLQVEQLYKLNAKRGMKNFAIIDLIQRDEAGNVSIDLTPEVRDLIFTRYPLVLRAFEQEVPMMMSEVRFWEMFFQSELFHKDVNQRKDNLAENAFFARYATDPSSEKMSDDTITGKKRSNELLHLSKVKHRMKIPVNQEIDLTSTLGDYHSKQEVELFDPDLNTGRSHTDTIIKRVNDDSALVLVTSNIGIESTSPDTPFQVASQSRDLSELKIPDPPHYREIDLSKLQVKDEKNLVSTMEPLTGYRRLFSELPLPGRERGYQYLPDIKRAEKFFQTEIHRLTKIENIRNQSLLLKEQKTGPSMNDPIEHTIALLPDDIKQQLYEKYFEVTELLRHFYFLLNRISAVEILPNSGGNSLQTKAKAIIKKLLEEKLPSLDSQKKRIHQEKGIYDEYTFEAILATMNGISLLIQRARMTWDATISS